MADTHELPKKYRIYCDNACAVDFEEIGRDKPAFASMPMTIVLS